MPSPTRSRLFGTLDRQRSDGGRGGRCVRCADCDKSVPATDDYALVLPCGCVACHRCLADAHARRGSAPPACPGCGGAATGHRWFRDGALDGDVVRVPPMERGPRCNAHSLAFEIVKMARTVVENFPSLAREVEARTSVVPFRRAVIIGLAFFFYYLRQSRPPRRIAHRDDCFWSSDNGICLPWPAERTAYLITANATSERALHSIGILESVGFEVKLQHAFSLKKERKDLIYSNKQAKLAIYRQIASSPYGKGGKHGWGYVFEDDIILVGKSLENFTDKVEFSVAKNLVGAPGTNGTGLESDARLGIYLGVCRPHRPPSAPPDEENRHCGTCAHAYGLSREGAAALLQYESERKNDTRAMDMQIKEWCIEVGGFPVSDPDRSSNWDWRHVGTFVQDRTTFASVITPLQVSSTAR